MDTSTFSERIKEIRDEITSAKTIKKLKQDDLKKLVEEAKLLKNELNDKYDIDVNSLQDLYDQTKKDLEKKLTEAEAKLSEIKADDEAE
jgi:septal ring factor EnvC (AmiA/AmiB activator)